MINLYTAKFPLTINSHLLPEGLEKQLADYVLKYDLHSDTFIISK